MLLVLVLLLSEGRRRQGFSLYDLLNPKDLYVPMYQETTQNFCPKNLGILVSGMGQLQGFFKTYFNLLNKKSKTCNWNSVDI